MQLIFDVLDPDTYFNTSLDGVQLDENPLLILSGALIDTSILSYQTSDLASTIIYDADRLFATDLLSFTTGAGNDHLYIGRFYIASVTMSTGAGDDVLILAHIEHDGSVDAGD